MLTTPSNTSTSTLFRRPLPPTHRPIRPLSRRSFSCQLSLATDVSSSSSSTAEEEAEANSKIGAKIRVNSSVKIYHVMKAPELDLRGLEGEIKQYVGVWKGKRISANLPFKVEFFVPVEGQEKPVKFVAHLKEEEFEYLVSSD